MERRIRKSSTDSVSSVDKTQYLDVKIDNTSKILMIPNVVDIIDAYEVFEEERDDCENYRLILTIFPFCTNALFNPMTEIVYKEGSPDVEVIYDGTTASSTNTDGCYGLSNPNRQQMIMNSEYSKEDIGYEYHPGFDFFNNHILRNESFKVVNTLTTTDIEYQTVFNSISDYMRQGDGDVIQITPRTSIDDTLDSKIDKHLYNYEDIMTYEESIENNLSEDMGWLGFTNTSTVCATEKSNKASPITNWLIWNDMDISRAINNKNACEFVDMYPDRSLFSFLPKINEYRKREEHNWDIILTYPYKNVCEHDIVYDSENKLMGLKIMYIEKTINSYGADILLFRTFTNHGLAKNEYFNLYAVRKNDTDSDAVTKIEEVKVVSTGNMSTEFDNDYNHFFYINDMTLLEDLLGLKLVTDSTSDNYGKWLDKSKNVLTDSDISNMLFENYEFRYRRIVSDIESKYYIRIFKKIPNLKKRRRNLTEAIATGNGNITFEEYITENAIDKNRTDTTADIMLDFDREHYKLAFSKTIYNDDVAQLVFTDNIDVSYLVDNLGRPLTEIYATILKSNRGHDKWYATGDETTTDPGDESVEFSHCFGVVSSGFDFSLIKADQINDRDILTIKSNIGDIKRQNQLDGNCNKYENNITNIGLTYFNNTGNDDGEEVYNEFIGDIVEFCPSNVTEYVLEPVCHRFNTAQRELKANNSVYNIMEYDEIVSDDYDSDGFVINTTNCDSNNGVDSNECDDSNILRSFQRKEGYYFNPHYKIQIKEFGNINQDGHYDIKVKTAQPAQLDGIYITVTTKLNHKLSAGGILYVCIDDIDRDDYEGSYENDLWYKFVASYVSDDTTFSMMPYNQTWSEFTEEVKADTGYDYNWITLSLALETDDEAKKIYLRTKNDDIPDYATKVDHNTFLWRDVIKPGDTYSTLTDYYPFTNNAFYVNKEINFFLKRQDAFGYNGLYTDLFPSDKEGNKYNEDTYTYTEEDDVVC